ncbi:hypothetical protein [Rhodococcus sp. NPDC047139]|uniref:hypothetical protein n=1 Tax=Rhodococcus sp. NPDC047139 TaxID=3155141 RepID=UPI0033CA0EB9
MSTEPPANITSEDTEVDWFHSGQLCDPDTGEVRRLVELHARFRDMPVGRHAGSLVFQRYCHRVCGVSVAAWVLHGVALDLRATSVRVRLADGTPDLLVLGRPTVQPGATAEDVLDTTFDGHLLPVARALRSVTGPGLGNLLGNIAAGFAGGFRTLTHRSPACLDVHEVRERAEELLSARPELRRGGDLRVLIGPLGPRLQYDRTSCCHWYAAPDGRNCSWCSRLTREERTQRFQEAMAEEFGGRPEVL